MGGAERDLIRNIPFLSEKFSIKIATLDPVEELKSICEKMNFEPASDNYFAKVITNQFEEEKQLELDSRQDKKAKPRV